MADLFDGAPATTPMFDLKQFALDLYSANNDASEVSVQIKERTLGNNADYDQMVKEKFNWPTESGPSPVVYPEDQEPNAIVALQPQRIRLFRLSYASYFAEETAEVFLQ